jgi:hypothetical protein
VCRRNRITERRPPQHVLVRTDPDEIGQIRAAGGKLLYLNFIAGLAELRSQKSLEPIRLNFFALTNPLGFSHGKQVGRSRIFPDYSGNACLTQNENPHLRRRSGRALTGSRQPVERI